MAAVIGSKGFWNRDPAKMPRTYGETYQTFIGSASSDIQILRLNTATTLTNTDYITAITSNAVSNTARTIVNVSGKSGWLTFAFGPAAASQATTFVVTVDGVATTIAVNADGSDQLDLGGQNNSGSGFLGLMLNSHSAGGYNNGLTNGAWIANNNNASYQTWNEEHQTLNQGMYNDANSHNRRVLDPFHAIHEYPSSVVRFENSLTVTVAGTIAVTDATHRTSGVIYVLDS